MFWCKTFVLALASAYFSMSIALPVNDQQSGILASADPLIMGETQVSTRKMHILSESLKKMESEQEEENSHYEQHKETQQNNNSATPVPITDTDDYFLPEKFPDLPNDEYLDIDEDATPFDFLKQSEKLPKEQVPTQSLSPTNNAINAIYITVPVFINTANGGAPFSISVGGQTIPINSKNPRLKVEAPKKITPTSKFNKLAYRPHPTRMAALPQSIINRHRSFTQRRSHVRKHEEPIRNNVKNDTYLLFYK